MELDCLGADRTVIYGNRLGVEKTRRTDDDVNAVSLQLFGALELIHLLDRSSDITPEPAACRSRAGSHQCRVARPSGLHAQSWLL